MNEVFFTSFRELAFGITTKRLEKALRRFLEGFETATHNCLQCLIQLVKEADMLVQLITNELKAFDIRGCFLLSPSC